MGRFIFAFLILGLTDIIQVLLIRELIINFQGTELSLGVILANWMFLLALGSWGLGRLADRLLGRVVVFIVTQILVSAILPSQILLARSINNLVGIEPGEAVGLLPIFYCSLIVLAPLGVLHGFQFALASRILAAGSDAPAAAVGKVYIAEALGCMAGGIMFTYLLVHYLHPLEIALGVGLLNLASALLLLRPEAIAWRTRGEQAAKSLVCVVILALGLGAHSLAAGTIDTLHDLSARWQWKGHNLVYYQNSIYGNISITQRGEQFNFYESGLPLFSVPNPDIAFNEEVTHFPMLYHPSPAKVLLIGGGIGGTLEQVLKHPVSEVHYLELDPLLVHAAREYSPQPFLRALEDPRVRVKHVDGRFFIKTVGETYDVVIVTLPSPSTLQLNRFYTREFFDEVASILNPSGILSAVIPSSEAYLSREMIAQNRCLYQTLEQAFGSVLIIPGDYNILLASDDAGLLGQGADAIGRRFEARDLDTRLLTIEYIRYKLNPARMERLSAPILAGNDVLTNRDLHPIGCYYDLALWNIMFYPRSQGFFHWVSGMDLWWFAVPSALLVLIPMGIGFRRRVSKPRLMPVTAAVVTTGVAGMTFSIVMLLALQTLEGYLYQRIAIIIAAFMLGLAFGGAYMNRIMYRLRREVLALAKIEAAIVVYSVLVALILASMSAGATRLPIFLPTEVLLSILNCVAGFLAGLEFPLANKIYLGGGGRVGQVAGSLYAADLLGGCLGAILASVFLVPVLGVPQTCFVIAMLNAASLALLIALANARRGA
ncbi:MAG TPA: hypothetical protein G4O03_08285 [Dehalococcoidia bacterium]|nr:hypothetical protein [Dehalococcoidia bacterium]